MLSLSSRQLNYRAIPRLKSRLPLNYAAAGIIILLAGTATPGYSGDGGLASQANVRLPGSIVAGRSGKGVSVVYIADTFNNRIRMVSMDTGIITTIAGTGVAGYSGDGGPALNAMLNGPNGIACDSNSSIYIADTYNNRIRVINSQNVITTVAGTGSYGYGGRDGLATLAALNNPLGVAWDTYTSRLYIADTNNNRIRVISKSGTISTVAGTGVAGYSGDSMLATTATISYPMKITTDVSGNLYIADTDNHRVRVITKSTGIITTVAGTGDAGYNGDGVKAVKATLFRPSDVTLDPSGNIYIADALNDRIRMVASSTGMITTVAGTGDAGFSGYGGLATAATISQPLGIDIDASGTVYIADTFNSRVLAVMALLSPTQTPTAAIAGSTLEINQVTLSTSTFFSSCYTVESSVHNLHVVILLLQEITGLTCIQASSPAFKIALLRTLASTMTVPSGAISFGEYIADCGDTIKLSYTLIISTSKSSATLYAALDEGVSDGSFASSLSYNAGLTNLSVKNTGGSTQSNTTDRGPCNS